MDVNHLQRAKELARETFNTLVPCIDPHCDQDGCIAHQIDDNEWEPQQCQYCYTMRFPIRDNLDEIVTSTYLQTEKQTLESAGDFVDELYQSGNMGDTEYNLLTEYFDEKLQSPRQTKDVPVVPFPLDVHQQGGGNETQVQDHQVTNPEAEAPPDHS